MNKFGKTVLALALTATIGFSGQAFAESATTTTTTGTGTTTGNTVRNYSDNMLDRMNTYTNANDRTGYGYGGNYNTANYRTNTAYRANAADNDVDWGWLGLIGLLGLAGLRGRNRDEREVR